MDRRGKDVLSNYWRQLCVDTNEKMEKELELIKVPFSVNIGEKVIVDEDIDLPMFLEEMNNSPEPTKTAAPSPGGFLSVLEGAKEAFYSDRKSVV